jgi:hypothetical protein
MFCRFKSCLIGCCCGFDRDISSLLQSISGLLSAHSNPFYRVMERHSTGFCMSPKFVNFLSGSAFTLNEVLKFLNDFLSRWEDRFRHIIRRLTCGVLLHIGYCSSSTLKSHNTKNSIFEGSIEVSIARTPSFLLQGNSQCQLYPRRLSHAPNLIR